MEAEIRSANRMIVILTVISLPLLLVGHRAGKTAPAADSDHKMKASFEAIQKKLPSLVEEGVKKDIGEWVTVKQVKTEIKLARFTGPSDAKITISITIKVEEEGHTLNVPQYVTFYLHYFDDRWTTTRADNSSKMADTVARFMLAIDLNGDK
jgi:hypothetical protein